MVNIARNFLIKRTEEATHFIVNKSANRITEVSKISLQNNSKTATNEHDKEIPKGRFVSADEKQGIIDDLRLIY